jgi:DNA-binding transcriptional LysR family regulator
MSILPDLEIRHLAALDAVASSGTFARAADQLGYTQSAVSQQIAGLERVVGAPVFDRPRGPKRVELTPLGHVLLAHARDVLARVETIGRDVERFRAGRSGTIMVGTFQSASSAILPDVVGRLRADQLDIEIRLVESDLDEELWARLGAGELDVSFVVGDIPEGFESQLLLADPFVLIAPDHEFPSGPVHVADFVDRPQIGQQDNSCQRLNEAGLRAAGGEPRYVFRTNDNGTVAAMVRNGMGVAVLPVLCVEPHDHGVAIHPIDPPIPSRMISIAWRSGRTLSPAAERFIDLASGVGREVSERITNSPVPS